MRKIYTTILVCAIALTACTTDPITISAVTHGDIIYATIADGRVAETEHTRVELNNLKQTVWTEGDEIFLWSDNDLSLWSFNGKTGDRSGTFTKTTEYISPDVEWDFKGLYYAIYNYTLLYSYFTDGTPALFSNLPATQSYKEQSYGLKANTMVGVSTDGQDYTFENILGYLRLSFTGDKRVRSITLTGNNDETMAGNFYFACIDRDNLYWDETNDLYTSITLDCGEEGVQLTATPKEFYFVVFPTEFTKGISVSVNFTDGSAYPISTLNSVPITRNTIQPMATIDLGGEVPWQSIVIAHTGEYMTMPTLLNATAGDIDWSDGYVSPINEGYYHNFSDATQSHTITINSIGATEVEFKDCVGITEIDFSNF